MSRLDILILSCLGLFLAAGIAPAQVINACVKSNGALKVVADLAECSSREMQLSWQVQGPPGPIGETGPAGEPGPAGTELHVFDRNGADLGIYAGREGEIHFGNDVKEPHVLWIYFAELGVTAKVNAEDGLHLLDSSTYFFTQPDCQGPAYSRLAGMLLQPNIGSNSAFFVTSTELVTVTVVSAGRTGTTIPSRRRLQRTDNGDGDDSFARDASRPAGGPRPVVPTRSAAGG